MIAIRSAPSQQALQTSRQYVDHYGGKCSAIVVATAMYIATELHTIGVKKTLTISSVWILYICDCRGIFYVHTDQSGQRVWRWEKVQSALPDCRPVSYPSPCRLNYQSCQRSHGRGCLSPYCTARRREKSKWGCNIYCGLNPRQNSTFFILIFQIIAEVFAWPIYTVYNAFDYTMLCIYTFGDNIS